MLAVWEAPGPKVLSTGREVAKKTILFNNNSEEAHAAFLNQLRRMAPPVNLPEPLPKSYVP